MNRPLFEPFAVDQAVNMPILFLDFDGVTHPEPCTSDRQFESLPLVEAVLRQHPYVPVVLSTSWRESYALEDLRDLFSRDIGQRVVGGTPVITRHDWDWYPVRLSECSRQREVEAWLHQSRTLDHPWVAIDDRSWWFEPGCQNLLATNRRIGFTPADAERLHYMLQERLP